MSRCAAPPPNSQLLKHCKPTVQQGMGEEAEKTEEEWRNDLSEEEYRVLRRGGTEPAFSGDLLAEERDGMYHCAACGQPLFSSTDKYDSGTGWPSFSDIVDNDNVELRTDHKLARERVEVRCSNCGSHLGHVFNDGPAPTGKRYCINSKALQFEADDEEET